MKKIIFKPTYRKENGKYKLFLTKPGEVHAVINKTKQKVVLVEFADEEQHDVERVVLI
jgi:hypothetical protein